MINDPAYKNFINRSLLDDLYYNGDFGASYQRNEVTFKMRYNYTDTLYDKVISIITTYSNSPEAYLDYQHTSHNNKLVIYGICNKIHYNQIIKLIKS